MPVDFDIVFREGNPLRSFILFTLSEYSNGTSTMQISADFYENVDPLWERCGDHPRLKHNDE